MSKNYTNTEMPWKHDQHLGMFFENSFLSLSFSSATLFALNTFHSLISSSRQFSPQLALQRGQWMGLRSDFLNLTSRFAQVMWMLWPQPYLQNVRFSSTSISSNQMQQTSSSLNFSLFTYFLSFFSLLFLRKLWVFYTRVSWYQKFHNWKEHLLLIPHD